MRFPEHSYKRKAEGGFSVEEKNVKMDQRRAQRHSAADLEGNEEAMGKEHKEHKP